MTYVVYPSSQLNATVGFELNKKIEACLLKDDIDGAVVVQGTVLLMK